MREMPVKKAGEILGETDQKLWRALFAHVDAAWKDLSWEDVIWVGADEMNRKKGHNYKTIVFRPLWEKGTWPPLPNLHLTCQRDIKRIRRPAP